MAVAVVSGPTEEEVHLGPHLHLHLGGVDDVVDDVEAPGQEVADPTNDQDGHCGAPAEGLLYTVDICHCHIIPHLDGSHYGHTETLCLKNK